MCALVGTSYIMRMVAEGWLVENIRGQLSRRMSRLSIVLYHFNVKIQFPENVR